MAETSNANCKFPGCDADVYVEGDCYFHFKATDRNKNEEGPKAESMPHPDAPTDAEVVAQTHEQNKPENRPMQAGVRREGADEGEEQPKKKSTTKKKASK